MRGGGRVDAGFGDGGAPDAAIDVPSKAEEALRSKMNELARTGPCKPVIAAFAACSYDAGLR